MERESGYYWVKMHSEKWVIAKYIFESNDWRMMDNEDVWGTTDFSEIDEHKIERK